jgi:hypothetical protein
MVLSYTNVDKLKLTPFKPSETVLYVKPLLMVLPPDVCEPSSPK